MARKNDYIVRIDRAIGDKIASLRKARKMPRRILASAMNVSSQQLTKYETGTNRVSVGRLVLIAEFLSVDLTYFFEGFDVLKTSKNVSNQKKNKDVKGSDIHDNTKAINSTNNTNNKNNQKIKSQLVA